MDGVLCDFYGSAKKALSENPDQKFPQSKFGFFLDLEEIPNAINSVNRLKEKYDVWILTRPSFQNLNCYTEKAKWVLDHLGFEMLKKTIISGDKSLVKGDFLIDDQNDANQDIFEGEWIEFKSEKFPDWKSITDYLLGFYPNPLFGYDREKFCDYIVGFKVSDIPKHVSIESIRVVNLELDNKLQLDIDFNRLNVHTIGDVINFAYFG